jgi:hypothetical protein
MLSTVLTSLQNLIPGRFTVASFFPILAFSVLNGVMLFWLNAPSRALFVQTITAASATRSAFLIAATLIAIAMLAYIFSALLPGIQLLLEGRWPGWLIAIFVPVQVKQLEELEARTRANNKIRAGLEELVGQKPKTQDWKDRLATARQGGAANHAGTNTFTKKSAGATAVQKLARLRRRSLPIEADSLEEAVQAMVGDLTVNNANHPGPDGQYLLDATQSILRRLIDYAMEHAQSENIRLRNKLLFNFGLQRPAPTLMGNIANTIQSYAEQRYNLNFEMFWSRMQRAIQRDKDFAPILQQAKMQLDFLVSCSSLTAIWAVIWVIVSFFTRAGQLPFLIAALLGPLIAYVWYRVAVAHYQTFADILRTSLDLFRFDLLKDLHLSLPDDVPGEQALWDTLHRIQSFYEPQSVHYQHPKST